MTPSPPSSDSSRSDAELDRVTRTGVIREVLIAATDMVPVGEEPYPGWSQVLAERIVEALEEYDRAMAPVDGAALRRGLAALMCTDSPENRRALRRALEGR